MSLKKAKDYLGNDLQVDSAIKDGKGQVIHKTYIKKTIPDGTIAKNIGVDSNGDIVKETPSGGGGTQINYGYNLWFYNNGGVHTIDVLILGRRALNDLTAPRDNYYGFIKAHDGMDGTLDAYFMNVSIIIFTSTQQYYFGLKSIDGDLYAFDGTKITTSNFDNYIGKMLYAASDLTIVMED